MTIIYYHIIESWWSNHLATSNLALSHLKLLRVCLSLCPTLLCLNCLPSMAPSLLSSFSLSPLAPQVQSLIESYRTMHWWLSIRQAYFKQEQLCTETVKSTLHINYPAHGSWRIFYCNKKKQRNCITGSFLGVLVILKTLTFKSGIEGLKSYRTIRT